MTDDTTNVAGSGTPAAAEPLRAESLDASLTVSDLPTSVEWYRDVFGFTVEREHHRDERLIAVSLRAGGIRILLSQDNGARGLDRARGEGFSLRLTTGQDIDTIASGIKARGGTLELEPTDMLGVRAFRLRDPDGFRFAVSSLPER